MYESWRHIEWETGADTTVRTDGIGHRRRHGQTLTTLTDSNTDTQIDASPILTRPFVSERTRARSSAGHRVDG